MLLLQEKQTGSIAVSMLSEERKVRATKSNTLPNGKGPIYWVQKVPQRIYRHDFRGKGENVR